MVMIGGFYHNKAGSFLYDANNKAHLPLLHLVIGFAIMFKATKHKNVHLTLASATIVIFNVIL